MEQAGAAVPLRTRAYLVASAVTGDTRFRRKAEEIAQSLRVERHFNHRMLLYFILILVE